MVAAPLVKRNHKAIKAYYERLKEIGAQGVSHEMAVREAFKDLLFACAKLKKWVLLTETSLKVGGKTIRPDGLLRDEWQLPHGYWEAKDSGDDLDSEIGKKIARGYPLVNTIFEDTRTAVLFQGGQEVGRFDLREEQAVADLINEFLQYEAPVIGEFERAVANFQERIPDLAEGLNEKIKEAHKKNKAFQTAYAAFFELARNALNPNLSKDAVDEMLIQHLLTERLIRRIFENEEFVQRNVIAAEIEKVIGALTSQHFNRTAFLGALDKFYVAIENAARNLHDFTEKQYFLNTVYERFFQGYSVKVADTHGIVYTPQEIVDFMCAAVEEVLRDEFGVGLGDEGVNVLDPATGTGSFIVHLLRRTPKDKLERAYCQQMFANEVMLMPYYIASLNIEHEYYELTGKYEPFEGLCFVDTLDLAEGPQMRMAFMTEKNTARVERQKSTPITVIIANPPYNAHQLDENDNNKNRKYDVIDRRVSETYAKDSTASNKNALGDAYVKFFRWATDRLQGRDGVVCYVSNNSFIDQKAFDGMRKHLSRDFQHIYLLDLKGNIRQDSMRDGIPLGEKHTVFGLAAMVGISITVLVRNGQRTNADIRYASVDFRATREEKFQYLKQVRTLNAINWETLTPDRNNTWLVPEFAGEFSGLIPLGTKQAKSASNRTSIETVFKTFSGGVKTNRDEAVYDFERNKLIQDVKQLVENYNSELDRYRRSDKSIEIDHFVDYEKIKWSRDLKQDLQRGNYAEFNENKVRVSKYRPFCKQYLFFDRILNEEVYVFPRIFPTPVTENENRVIWIKVGFDWPMFALIANSLVDIMPRGGSQCFPLFVYDEDGSNRRDNITDWALTQFCERYGDPTITKEDIFYYVYGLLHHPEYRTKYADNLKRELPRIPFAPDFRAFSNAGRRLADWHLNYETAAEYKGLKREFAKGKPLSWRVEKMRLSKDKTALKVNDTLTIAGIPAEAFEYRLGNRSALEWVIDQYQVKEDKRSGIKSDPNQADDEQYIVRLVGQVVGVSVETVKIVNGLPEDFGG